MLLNLHASPVLFYYLCQREIRCLCFYHSALSVAEHSSPLWTLWPFLWTQRRQSTTAGCSSRTLLHSCGSSKVALVATLAPMVHVTQCRVWQWVSSALNTLMFFFFCSCRWGSQTGAGATKSSPGIVAF